MIQKLEINGVHLEIDEDLRKYATRKIGRLDLFMPLKIRAVAHAEIKLKAAKAKNKNERTCEVILHLPHEVITVKETTINMYAAIDVVEAKLKNQLKKYKETHGRGRLRQRIVARFKHRPAI